MRAIVYDRIGPAREVLRLEDLPTPVPGPGEVRVRIRWSSVNPSDVKTRSGFRTSVLPFARITPHSDGMGVIDAVGDGVDAARIGRRVWVWNAAWGRPFGTAAEFICLPQRQAVDLPDGVDDEAGACLGIPALTALHAVLTEGGVAGKTVLVAGGAGAVGHYAVQFASRLGAARVIATVSSDAKAEHARRAGADATLNYRTEPVAERVRELTAGRGVDRVIEVDLAANATLNLDILRPGGECVVYGSGAHVMNLPFAPLIAKNIALRFFIVYNLDDADRARAEAVLQRMLERSELEHAIAERVPLARMAEAHEIVEQGRAIGNVVVDVASTVTT